MLFLLFPHPVAAELIRYRTDDALSRVSFRLLLPFVEAEGTVERFRGTLLLNPKDFTRSELRGALDLSSVHLAHDLAPFGGISSPELSFVSTGIERVNSHRYFVRGIISRRSARWTARLPIDILSLDPPRFRVAVTAPIPEWDDDLPLPVEPGRDRGELDAELKFVRDR